MENIYRTKVYVDGFCMNAGKKNARAGYGVLFATNHPNNISKRLSGKQTIERAVLHAAIECLEQFIFYTRIEVRTDSLYLIKAMTEWMPKYDEKTKYENFDLMWRAYDLADDNDVIFTHHASKSYHDGIGFAEKLANAGALK